MKKGEKITLFTSYLCDKQEELVQQILTNWETLNPDFWKPIIEDTDFKQFITNKYSILNNVVNLGKLDQH